MHNRSVQIILMHTRQSVGNNGCQVTVHLYRKFKNYCNLLFKKP